MIVKSSYDKINLAKVRKEIIMADSKAFATKIPNDLILVLDEVCKKLGLRKNFVIEVKGNRRKDYRSQHRRRFKL